MPPTKKATPAPAKKAAAEAPKPAETADAPTGAEVIADKHEKSATAEIGTPAWRRANDVAALEQELEMCERAKKTDRVSAIKEQLKKAKSSVSGRSEAPKDEA